MRNATLIKEARCVDQLVPSKGPDARLKQPDHERRGERKHACRNRLIAPSLLTTTFTSTTIRQRNRGSFRRASRSEITRSFTAWCKTCKACWHTGELKGFPISL